MKIRLLILSVVLFSITQCCTTKNGFQKRIPFTLIDSFYQDWTGGQAGVSGTTVQLFVKNIKSNVTPNFIYFRGRKEKIDIKDSEKGILWIANFPTNTKNSVKKDIVMDADSKKEFGNTLPEGMIKSFDLKDDEAVISYYKNGHLKYYKLQNLTKKETLFYPAARPKR